MNNTTLPWILAGYKTFSKEGPKGLKVEALARQVNKNKSSFYHHFVDLDIFIRFLLEYHLERAKIMAIEESKCQNIDPELFQTIIKFKEDLLFNRQLRVHRNNSAFEKCFQQTSMEVSGAILQIWTKELELTDHSKLSLMILEWSLENFYFQITEETLNYEWLKNYFIKLKKLVKEFKKQNTFSPINHNI